MSTPIVAVVGSQHVPVAPGSLVAQVLTSILATRRFVAVSGSAFGVSVAGLVKQHGAGSSLRIQRKPLQLVYGLIPGRSAGSGLVAFVTGRPLQPVWPCSQWPQCGSSAWSAVAVAAGCGIPVIVFPVKAKGTILPLWQGGAWQPAAATGVWAGGFRWAPRIPYPGY
jgi:hypothetical protein